MTHSELVSLDRGAPNLDCLTDDPARLWALADCLLGQPIRAGRIMFPERPTGYVRATQNLANYAYNRATAMRCRASGDMIGARIYEDICENILTHLPTFARW